MFYRGKRNVIGILVDAIDYDAAVAIIISAARERRGLIASALAVHGVMMGALDPEQKYRLNHFDLLVPDGQPVRWALNAIHDTKLHSRVYGPTLTLKICEQAALQDLPIYLYGSTPEVLSHLLYSLRRRFPQIQIAGSEPSKFRQLTLNERNDVWHRIRDSGAALTLVGLGCPRQEVFAFELRNFISMPILAVGAAFPFIAGCVPQAPNWMQEHGLEWLFRLTTEPRRLWRRYLYLNPYYVLLGLAQFWGLAHFSHEGVPPVSERLVG